MRKVSESQDNAASPLVRLISVEPFLAYVKTSGGSVGPSLRRLGIDETDIADPARLVHPEVVYGLVNDLALSIRDPYFGVHVGEAIDFQAWPMWASIYRRESHLFAALTQGIQAMSPLQTSVENRLEVCTGVSIARILRPLKTGNAPVHSDGFSVATHLRMFDQFEDGRWEPDAVTVQTAYPEAIPPNYRGIRIERVEPGSHSIHFPTSWLLRPLVGQPSHRDIEPTVQDRPSLIAAIAAVAPRLLSDYEADLAGAVASRLGLSASDLPAALRRLDTSFPREIRELRLRLAEKALSETDDPLAAIALRLGFSEAASFTRFFKAHKGATPKSYRKERQVKA